MKLSVLALLVTVADELSFVKASEKLFISQSAVTQHVKKAEEELGFPLFLRDKHHVSLTAQGERFLSAARKILAIYDRAVADCRSQTTLKSTLRIGYIGQVHLHAFQEILAAFEQKYPDCHLLLSRLQPGSAIDIMKSGQCDLIITPKELFEEYHIPFHQVYSDQHYCVMKQTHRLANKFCIDLASLAPYRILMPDMAIPFGHMLLLQQRLNDTGLAFHFGNGGNLDKVTLKLLTADTDVAIMPGFAVPVHPALTAVPLNDHVSIPVGVVGQLPPGSPAGEFVRLARAMKQTM